MNLIRIRFIGTEADESVTIFQGGFFTVRIFLWNGLAKVGETGKGTDFAHFPVDVFENLGGVKITHVTFSGFRGNPEVQHIGFMEFTDIGGTIRKSPIPLGDILGKTFGFLLLSSLEIPISVPLLQPIAQSFFTVPPIVLPG